MDRDYTGVWVPKEIWTNKDLSPIEKMYLVEINSLDSSDGGCFASNKHFEKVFGQIGSNASKVIKRLEKKGWITINYVYNGKEIDKRIIKVNHPPYPNKYSNNYHTYGMDYHRVGYLIPEGYGKNYQDSITILEKQLDNNNKSLNIDLLNKFWNEYPKKVSKGLVEEWFIKNNPSSELVDLMINKIKLFKGTDKWKKDDGKFIPYPVNWLNAKSWEDETVINKLKYDTNKIYHDEFIGDYKFDEDGSRIFV